MRDNYDLWQDHNARQEAWLSRRPQCEKCGKHIQDEHYFFINNEVLCQECMEDAYMFSTEDYGE